MCKFCDILYSLEINRVLISIIFGIVYRRFSKDSKKVKLTVGDQAFFSIFVGNTSVPRKTCVI